MRYRQQPEDILKQIGIYDPDDIDLELVAYSLGAEVKIAPLSGCEGNIIGTSERAIITINGSAELPRQRFSLGHEIGHWVNDKGKNLTYRCSAEDMKQHQNRRNDFRQQKEVRANNFSAELMMPRYLFVPKLVDCPITFESVEALANTFRSSRTSSAIRLVEVTDYPCMLVCWSLSGSRQWFVRSETVPEEIWPFRQILKPKEALIQVDTQEVDADKWIDRDNACDYTLNESVFFNGYDYLSLLWWQNEEQLMEMIEEN